MSLSKDLTIRATVLWVHLINMRSESEAFTVISARPDFTVHTEVGVQTEYTGRVVYPIVAPT